MSQWIPNNKRSPILAKDREEHQPTPPVSHRVIPPPGFDFREYAFNYTDAGRKEYYQQQVQMADAMNEAIAEAREAIKEDDGELVEAVELPGYEDLNQRLTKVEIRLGLGNKDKEDKPLTHCEKCGIIACVVFIWSVGFLLIYSISR